MLRCALLLLRPRLRRRALRAACAPGRAEWRYHPQRSCPLPSRGSIDGGVGSWYRAWLDGACWSSSRRCAHTSMEGIIRSVFVTSSKSHPSVGGSALSPSPTRHLCADATSIPPRAALIAAPCARRWSSADSGSSSIDVLEVNYQGSKCDLKKKKDDMKSVARPGQSIPCRKPTKKKGSGRRAPRERAGADREARNWRCAAHFPAAILPCKIHFDIMNVRY